MDYFKDFQTEDLHVAYKSMHEEMQELKFNLLVADAEEIKDKIKRQVKNLDDSMNDYAREITRRYLKLI